MQPSTLFQSMTLACFKTVFCFAVSAEYIFGYQVLIDILDFFLHNFNHQSFIICAFNLSL